MAVVSILETIARRLPVIRNSKMAKLSDPGNPHVSLGMSLQRTGNLLPFITNIRLSTGMIKQCLELSSNLQRPFLNTNNLAYVFLSEDVY